MTTITFTDGTTRGLLKGEFVERLPGWLVIQRCGYDPDFGDEGYHYTKDVVSFPSERIAKVDHA